MNDVAVYQQWLEESREKMIQEYERLGFKASGNYAEKLKPETISAVNLVKAIMYGPAYAEQMQFGRGITKNGQKGSTVLRDAIRQWIDDKGITPREAAMSKDTLAFLIARKINREGYSVADRAGVITNVITPEWINELIRRAGTAKLLEVTSDIKRLITELSK